ncbi:hypothetical protein K474DRAFT_1660443, partial [Panus rudis PR-1116 ss-1]
MASSSTQNPPMDAPGSANMLPSSSTFSFIAPYPPPASSSAILTSPQSSKQQRRVSLALPSSPRLFPAWSFRDDTSVGVNANTELSPEKKGKMRRIDCVEGQTPFQQTSSTSTLVPQSMPNPFDSHSHSQPIPEKKPRKKWSEEETQMLVKGCNKWGVGNWKAILNDPELTFDNRSPVDLKDRFRTYFPDAYRKHYPNAKTHLSSKVRSALPDGTSIFEKTRSKKRRPFTEEEDRALKEGYDKHGTVWATIVKENPIFLEQGRRSTDLRDRFRNAFPELYLAAGYKPRASVAKKKKLGLTSDASTPADPGFDSAVKKSRGRPIRAATDDQLAMGSSGTLGPVRRKRRHTTQGLFRGGTKSVPESTTNSEDEDSSDGEEGRSPASALTQSTTPNPPQSVSNSSPDKLYGVTDTPTTTSETDMDVQPSDSLSRSTSDFAPDSTDTSQTHSTSWSTLDTPVHPWSNPNGADSNVVTESPTPASDYFVPRSQSPTMGAGPTMIGKSAWGPQDWLSANPRLDNSNSFGGAASTSSTSSFLGENQAFSPSPLPPSSPSPFSSNAQQSLSLSHVSLNHLTSSSHPSSNLHNLHLQYNQPYSQAVFDRYDLFPSSSHDLDFDLDFISEGFAPSDTHDAHSAFSDPSMGMGGMGMGMRNGGFTHHSNSAGDLIFGARTHQPSGYMHNDYGPGFGFGGYGQHTARDGGLGLEGVQSSASSPKVQHTPALPGIDEIELTSITLDDRDDVMGMPLEEAVNIPPSDNDPVDRSQGMPPPPVPLEDIIGIHASDDESHNPDNDMNIHITPPHTPLFAARTSGRPATSGRTSTPGTHGSLGGSSHGHHNRSVSVPPSEHRSPMPKASKASMSQAQTPNQARQYKPLPPASRVMFQPFQLPTTVVPAQLHTHAQPQAATDPPQPTMYPVQSHPGDIYNVPFLDLHYYSNNSPHGGVPSDGYNATHGRTQALDLAQTMSQGGAKLSCVSPSQVQLVPPPGMSGPGPGGGTAMLSHSHSHTGTVRPSSHHRGQSAIAISPQDLLLRKGADNKRKRASWDGGL